MSPTTAVAAALVALIVCGCSSSATRLTVVQDPATEPPQQGAGTSPLGITVDVSPESPRAGETVTFTMVAVDVDARVLADDCVSYHWFGDTVGRPGGCIAACSQERPDDPPAEPSRVERVYRHVYEQPGTYTAGFHVSSNAHCARNQAGSEGELEVVVDVAP